MQARRLLKGLLLKKPKKRWGIDKIKSSKFFTKHLDWGEVLTKAVEPPFKPEDGINAMSQEEIEDKGFQYVWCPCSAVAAAAPP